MKTISLSVALAVSATLAVGGCQSSGSGAPSLTEVTGTQNTSGAASSLMGTATDVSMLVHRPSVGQMTADKTDVNWMDNDAFDRQLSSAMAKHPAQIRVNLDTGANQLPARINTWFGEVTDRGGHVNTMTQVAWARLNGEQNDQTAEAMQTRGLFLLELLPFVFKLVADRIHEEAIYGPSANYDAVLVTSNSREHIQMLVFQHKEPPPSKATQ